MRARRATSRAARDLGWRWRKQRAQTGGQFNSRQAMAYVAGSVAPAMKPNYVLRSWREGGQNVGAWLDSADAFIAENMGAL